MRRILLFVLVMINCLLFAQNKNNISYATNYAEAQHSQMFAEKFGTASCTPIVTTGAISPTTICAGTIIVVPVSFTDCVDANNIFIVELSDAAGSFASPITIGSITSTSIGNIAAAIPPTTVFGVGYRIRVTASSPATIGSDNGTDLVLLPKPNSGFSINNSTQCITTNNFVFSNTSTGSITGYNWSFGNGNTSTATNTTNTYSTAGNFIVKLVATGTNSCKDSTSKTVSVNTIPTANYAVDNTTLCQGAAFNFTNSSSNNIGTLSYVWNFGDATTANTTNTSHAFTSGGNFNIKLVATTVGGCKDSITKSVTVLPNEKVAFSTNSTSQCFNQNSFVFTNNTSGNTTSFWDFGDGITSTVTSPVKVYAAIGTYTIKLVSTNTNGCKDSLTQVVLVNVNPIAGFTTAGTTNCTANLTIDFTNTSTGTGNTYSWNFGDFTTSTAVNPTKTYALPGTYIVKLMVTNASGCKDSSTQTITFVAKSVASFTVNNSSQCSNNQNFVFTNTSSGSVISSFWDFGDGITSTVTNPNKNYATAGFYTV